MAAVSAAGAWQHCQNNDKAATRPLAFSPSCAARFVLALTFAAAPAGTHSAPQPFDTHPSPAMKLNDEEQAMLAGEAGPAARLAIEH